MQISAGAFDSVVNVFALPFRRRLETGADADATGRLETGADADADPTLDSTAAGAARRRLETGADPFLDSAAAGTARRLAAATGRARRLDDATVEVAYTGLATLTDVENAGAATDALLEDVGEPGGNRTFETRALRAPRGAGVSLAAFKASLDPI